MKKVTKFATYYSHKQKIKFFVPKKFNLSNP